MPADPDNPSSTDGWFTQSIKTITAAAAAVGAILGVVVAYDPAVTAWCKNFGVLCTYDVETPVHVVKVSDGSTCDNAAPQICVERTTPKRLLDTSSYKFLRQVTAGQFENVKAK